MPLPAAGPATLDAVKAHLRITGAEDDAALITTIDAVNAQVRGWRCADASAAAGAWTADVVLGAVMLAARLWRRRDSPAGVATFGDLGALYVSRNDPDVAQLLRLGTWQTPAVG